MRQVNIAYLELSRKTHRGLANSLCILSPCIEAIRESYDMFRVAGILVICAMPAFAEVEGQADPKFQSALELWLAGEDLAALEGLKSLAYDGNIAAQIFLGRAATLPYSGELIAKLSRDEWRKLTRAQSATHGNSGVSWLEVAAKEEPLAQAFMNANNPDELLTSVQVFLEYGETGALIMPLYSAFVQGQDKFDTVF